MLRKDCTYDECSAPICPLDEGSMKNCIWYPDEEICKKQPAPLWVKNQKKIAKRIDKNFDAGYFAHAMLDQKFKITSAIKGLDPDRDESEQMQRWFKAHPVYETSEAQKEAAKKATRGIRGQFTEPIVNSKVADKISPFL